MLFRSTSRKTREREPSFFGKLAALLTPPPSPRHSPSPPVDTAFERHPHERRGSDDSTSSKSSTFTAISKPKSPTPSRTLFHQKSLASIHPIPSRNPDFIEPRSPPAYTCAFKDCWSDYCPTHNPNGSRKVAQARRVASMKSLRRLHTASQATMAASGSSTGPGSALSMGSLTSRSSASTPPLPPSPPATARYERKNYECYASNCVATNCPKHGAALTRPTSAPPSPITASPSDILYFPLPPGTVPVPAIPPRPQAPTPERMADRRPSFSRAATTPEVVYPTRSHAPRPSASSRASSRTATVPEVVYPTRSHAPGVSTSSRASSRTVHAAPEPEREPMQPLKVVKRVKSFAPSGSLSLQPSKSAKDMEQALRDHKRVVDSRGASIRAVAELSPPPPPPQPQRQRSSRRQRSVTLVQEMLDHPYATARPVAYAV